MTATRTKAIAFFLKNGFNAVAAYRRSTRACLRLSRLQADNDVRNDRRSNTHMQKKQKQKTNARYEPDAQQQKARPIYSIQNIY